ncbi:hypothetical protein, partial [Microtetraspora sp. NBRC 13810]|uniref:hypothetical protein n=1 Tax=Microtetraspora sp. NBRC 13810 TaxID=3030990 RepID=UPI002556068D
MTARLLLVLLLAGAFAIVPGAAACACSCATAGPEEQVRRAAAVFTGTVVSARPLSGDPLGPRPPVVHTLRADHVYKGEANAEFEVVTDADEASCGYGFAVGTRYLVFAGESRGAVSSEVDTGVALGTTLCSGNRRIQAGEGPPRAGDEASGEEPLDHALLTALGTPRTPSAPAPQGTPSTLATPTTPSAPAG